MATDNTTVSGLGIPFCDSSHPILAADYAIAALNAASIVLNVFHIVVLSTMPSLKGANYRHILVHIALGDIAYAAVVGAVSMLNKPSYYSVVTLHSVAWFWSFAVMSIWVRYWLVAVASLDRYYALCRALEYKTSRLMKRLPVWLPFLWLLCFFLALISMYVLETTICFSRIVGPFFLRTPQILIYYYMAQFAPSVVTVVLLARVLVELCMMRKKTLTNDEKIVKSATKYLIAIMALLYVGLLPPLVSNLSIHLCMDCDWILLGFYLSNQLVSSLYGIFNVIVYGFMTPAYRHKIRILFCKTSQVAAAH